jgi:glycosyltransferase involved in cell wall biosynthesis
MVCDGPAVGPGVVDIGKVATDEELAQLFRRAWAFCMPATYDGIGLTYLESLASGTATVLSPNRAAREALGDPPAGLLPDDEELGGALVRVLTDGAERSRLESAARARAEHYNWDRHVAEMTALYARVARTTERAQKSA